MLRAFFQPALDIAVLIASDEDDFAGFFLSAVYPNGQLAVSAAGQFSAQPLLVPLSLLYMEGAFFLFPAMLCRRILEILPMILPVVLDKGDILYPLYSADTV